MPNFKTYHNNKNIYSVDMMLSYINIYGHPIVKLNIEEFIPQLREKVWGAWSPLDVIEKIHLKKYQTDAKRIKEANLSYPVIVTAKHTIVDGYHRIAKAYLEKKKYIDVYVFESELMNKFIIDKDMDFVKVHQHTNVNQMLELWARRFCNFGIIVTTSLLNFSLRYSFNGAPQAKVKYLTVNDLKTSNTIWLGESHDQAVILLDRGYAISPVV